MKLNEIIAIITLLIGTSFILWAFVLSIKWLWNSGIPARIGLLLLFGGLFLWAAIQSVCDETPK